MLKGGQEKFAGGIAVYQTWNRNSIEAWLSAKAQIHNHQNPSFLLEATVKATVNLRRSLQSRDLLEEDEDSENICDNMRKATRRMTRTFSYTGSQPYELSVVKISILFHYMEVRAPSIFQRWPVMLGFFHDLADYVN